MCEQNRKRVFDCILTYLAMNTISEYSYSLVFMPSSQHRGEEFYKKWNTMLSAGGHGESGVCVIHVGTWET